MLLMTYQSVLLLTIFVHLHSLFLMVLHLQTKEEDTFFVVLSDVLQSMVVLLELMVFSWLSFLRQLLMNVRMAIQSFGRRENSSSRLSQLRKSSSTRLSIRVLKSLLRWKKSLRHLELRSFQVRTHSSFTILTDSL